jgi:16S rRNA (guanine527-N7)-methyltransferase
VGTGNNLQENLSAGLQQLDIQLDSGQQQKLLAFLNLLQKWNRSFNLTAIREPQAMISELLLDALVALPQLSQGPILDVGTGAGLPGVPLAIARPDLAFTLLDSNGKKIRFIKQVVIELQIANVDVVQSRIEAFQPAEHFATVISRAYADISKLVTSTSHLLMKDGFWLAWKGELNDAELTKARQYAQVDEVFPVQLPGVSRPRHLVKLKHLQG